MDYRLELVGQDAAYKFATKLFSAYPKYIKSIVLFGSYAKQEESSKSDVDVLVIVDDVTTPPDKSFVGAFNFDIDRFRSEIKEVNLHITVLTLTGFWKGLIAVDPFTINAVRYGFPLIDTGFFEPIKVLLVKGDIKPTQESIYAAITRSEIFTGYISKAKAEIIEDAYWSVVNSAQAYLMSKNIVPPSPEKIEEELAKTDFPASYTQLYKDIASTFKALEHGELKSIDFSLLENITSKAKTFNDFIISKFK
jgi:hypothetical protein